MDATQDLFIRGIGPPLAAALVGAGAVTVCLLIRRLPYGSVLALGLLAAGAVVLGCSLSLPAPGGPGDRACSRRWPRRGSH